MEGNYFMPTQIVIGERAILKNSALLNFGSKALIVTGKNSSKKNGSLEDVKKL